MLTCCHNSLCAVGGTINEDDHVFGLTACKKYGGIYLPPHMGVIHQYMREAVAGGGCADLLAVSWLMLFLEQEMSDLYSNAARPAL